MSLSSLNLDAFAAVAKERSFSSAAKRLHITQSALSQRVLNLEQEIGSTLFIRDPAGVKLTDLGNYLLRYCHSKETLESEFLSRVQSNQATAVTGIVRVAAFSTITRPIIIPALSDLASQFPGIRLEVRTEELRNLPSLLFSGAADFIFGGHPVEKQGLENHHVGFEENVLIRSATKKTREDIYLDHDDEDTTTFDFFKTQERQSNVLKRHFLNDIYSIIEGVRLGIGRAVVPIHLVRQIKGIKVVTGHKRLKVPVYLTYYSQPFYTQLQKLVIEHLRQEVPKHLSR